MRFVPRPLLISMLLVAALASFAGPDARAASVAAAGASEQAGAEHGADEGGSGPDGEHHAELGSKLPLWWVVPFAGILLSIAIFPVAAPRFWHAQFPKVSFAWAAMFAVPFLLVFGEDAVYAIVHIYLIDYVPFIILLWGLFTVAGGIVVRGTFRGTPAMNLTLLATGTLLASFVGTTGAAMLMIRPVLRANAPRKRKTHVLIFFIFLVANIGGSLTPLGDPPLFLGFLHSVPFTWTLVHMPMPMGLLAGMLLCVFFALDSITYKKDLAEGVRFDEDEDGGAPVSFAGLHNVFFLGGIIGSVLLSGIWHAGEITILGVHVAVQNIVRDLLIIGCGILSLRTTRRSLRRENEFTWGPILEVGYLFAGIFMTIIPALAILSALIVGALIIALGDLDTLRLWRSSPGEARARQPRTAHRGDSVPGSC